MALPYITEAQLEKAVGNKQDKIEVSAADAGKMVAVDEQGKLALVDAPSGGIKLYKHVLRNGGYHIDWINTQSEAKNYNDIIGYASFTSVGPGFNYDSGTIVYAEKISYYPGGNTIYLTNAIIQGENQILKFYTSASIDGTYYADATDTVTEL